MKFLRRGSQSLTVFCYHAVVAEPLPVRNFCFVPLPTFRRQTEGIAARYKILPLSSALEQLWTGTLPADSACITFDDGFRNNAELAFPLLREMGIPSTLFLCTGPVVEPKLLWFARLHRAVCLTNLLKDTDRGKASSLWQADLKRLRPAELEEDCDKICSSLDVPAADPHDPDFGMMDGPMVQAAVESGCVDIGAHTRNHAILSLLSREEQRAEIAQSVTDIEALTGHRPTFFAYPNGERRDFNSDSRAILQELGFTAAFTSREDKCRRSDPHDRLPRVLVGDLWEPPGR